MVAHFLCPRRSLSAVVASSARAFDGELSSRPTAGETRNIINPGTPLNGFRV